MKTWDWQAANLTARLTDIGGNNAASGFPFGSGSWFNFTGEPPSGGGNSFNFKLPPGAPPSNSSGGFPLFPSMNRTLNTASTDY
ncbi:hypothetical protein F5X99DRAFT_411018 [Biscogniauxia marginata]|nr:hypothetical protein F5X99DRAFT_411018 [Biscogniauxia marginata]